MIGQYLSQTNESATVAKTKIFPPLNKALEKISLAIIVADRPIPSMMDRPDQGLLAAGPSCGPGVRSESCVRSVVGVRATTPTRRVF